MQWAIALKVMPMSALLTSSIKYFICVLITVRLRQYQIFASMSEIIGSNIDQIVSKFFGK